MGDHYYEYLPNAINIRRKGNGETDPIVASIKPEQLIFGAGAPCSQAIMIRPEQTKHQKEQQIDT